MEVMSPVLTGLQPHTLVQLLSERADETPDHPLYTFLSYGEDAQASLTCGELDRCARSVAVHLRKQVDPGDRVLLLYPPGLDYVTAFFGCLYAGAVAVPAYLPHRNRPMPRLRAVISDCRATAALTTAKVWETLKGRIRQEAELDELRWLISDTLDPNSAESWQPPGVDAKSLAFLQYTSGSTGVPKGVMLSHGNLLHNLEKITGCFAQGPDSLAVIWLPPYHDMGLIGGILQPLYGGSRVVLMSPADFFQRPFRWLEAISRFRATTSGGPNFAFELCLRKITPEERANFDLSSWTVAFNGAEPVSHQTMEDFARGFAVSGFRHEAFRPCYGLAEGTLMVSGIRETGPPVAESFDRDALLRSEARPERPGPATQTLAGSGRPLDGQDLRIVDPQTGRPCPPGQVGEIWVASPSVARGYWENEVSNQEVFGARLAGSEEGPYLRTGDLGFLFGGELFVTGRLKDVIILRGRNYYPQDIERTVAASHCAFQQDSGVAFSIDHEGEEKLVIVQELQRSALRSFQQEEAVAALRAAVSEHHQLQVHAVAFLRPASLPKTSSGKVQRRATRELFLSGELNLVGEAVVEKAATEDLEEVALTREDLLAREDSHRVLDAFLRVKIRYLLSCADFPDDKPLVMLGMDSLLAVELQHEIEKALDVSIPFTVILEDVTRTELRTRILSECAKAPAVSHPPEVERGGEGPVTHGERALWFLQKLVPQNTAYNLAGAIRLDPAPEPDRLRKALALLQERHPALRTSFPDRGGQPRRRIHEGLDLDLEVVDARSWSEDELRSRLEEERHRPFDLEQQPPVRVSYYQTTTAPVLFLNIHHILADFWSLTVLARELAHLLDRDVQELEPAGDGFSPNAHARAEARLLAEKGEGLLDYWRTYLEGAPTVLDLPLDKPRPAVQTFPGDTVYLTLESELMSRLTEICGEQDTTVYTLLLGAFAVLLHRHSGQKDVLVGTPTANRTHAGMADAISYLINLIVVRSRCHDDPEFTTFLRRLRRDILDNLLHAALPFPYLVERLQPEGGRTISPLFQAMFVYQKAPLKGEPDLTSMGLSEPNAKIQVGELSMQPIPLENHTSQFDLTLVFGESSHFSRVAFNYNSDLFHRESIERLADRFQVLLKGIATDPGQRISALPLLSQNERELMLKVWNDTRAPFEHELCIHELFEKRAAKSPGKTALIFEDQSLSYAELDSAANRLAHHLRDLGVGVGSRVGVCLRRSPQMVVALLGTLKAGAAYVPLDPTYPTERLTYVLDDARASVLLTHGSLAARFPGFGGRVVVLDQEAKALRDRPETPPPKSAGSTDLAYVIYTSGSTGKAKGVMLPHVAVTNFFAGMDQAVGCGENDGLLAVTSISFDISVLELFWTLSRGCRVILLTEEAILSSGAQTSQSLDFSLFYFSADASGNGGDKYRLLREGTRYADGHGFIAVWTPERHFHAFGGLYPNPAVTGAALSAMSHNVRIRSGSVVLPLHHPIRVAEEWSVVDNFSGGRAEVSVASGWHPNDFVLRPENYEDRKRHLSEGVATLRKLWAGEAIEAVDGSGKTISVSTLPRPVQDQIPIWYTTGGNPESFAEAGRLGTHLLTHLLGQTFEEVAEKIAIYRQAREQAGFDPATGRVALMLHTYIGEDLEEIREKVRGPFTGYLRSAFGLVTRLIETMDLPLDVDKMTEPDRETLLDFAFDRYFDTAALFGTPTSVQPLLGDIVQMGVDEVACLIDFGIAEDDVLASLPLLKQAMEEARQAGRAAAYSLEAQSRRHLPTRLQCTPSTLRMLLHQDRAVEALGSLEKLLLGGEALPAELARELAEKLPARVINMYGPTETAIWSATWPVTRTEGILPIGRPIANTVLFVVDTSGQIVPVGTSGELLIGGQGLARGYERRPALTALKFTPDPFRGEPGARLYRTGDLVRYRRDGEVEFLGRLDFQVKVRGYRIELGEIETVLEKHEGVGEAVVLARQQADHTVLIAYLVPRTDADPPTDSLLREHLERKLPAYMVPSQFVVLKSFPLTANGKVDRKAFPDPEQHRQERSFVAPHGRIEQQVAEIWSEALGLPKVSANDNFFDLGGHSLLMSQVHGRVKETFARDIPLIKLLELPTISSLARYLAESGVSSDAAQQGRDRAQKQREARRRRRVPATRAS